MGTDRCDRPRRSEAEQLLHAQPVQQEQGAPRHPAHRRRRGALHRRTDQRYLLPVVQRLVQHRLVRRQTTHPVQCGRLLLETDRRVEHLLQQCLHVQLLQPVCLRSGQLRRLLQQLREFLRPRQVCAALRRLAGMGQAPALARRLLHPLGVAGLHPLHAEKLAVLPHHQRQLQQPEPERDAEPHIDRQPTLPAPRFRVHGLGVHHPALVEMGQQGL